MNSAYIFRVKIPIIGPVRLYSKIMRNYEKNVSLVQYIDRLILNTSTGDI